MKKITLFFSILCLSITLLNSCGIGKKFKDFHKPVDLRNEPLDPDERARRNIEEGRGVSLGTFGSKSTTYEFSTSNPMWRASLETLDFIPLTTVDYSGGMIITDWYSENSNSNESIKISIRFLTNEIRSDSLDIKIFYKKCETALNCVITEQAGNLKSELTKKILKQAAIYAKETKDKNFKPYKNTLERN